MSDMCGENQFLVAYKKFEPSSILLVPLVSYISVVEHPAGLCKVIENSKCFPNLNFGALFSFFFFNSSWR